jgi:zinc transporter, ZIP family
MWLAIIAVSAISGAGGYVVLDPESGRTGALAQAFAAGALLDMLADTLLPEAYEVGGVVYRAPRVAGFAISIALDGI